MIELKIQKQKYKRWLSARISRSIDNASGEFSLSTAEIVAKVGDEIQIIIDGMNYINGFVESIRADNSVDGKTFEISGRDRVGDLVDSSLPDGVKNFKSGSTLENIIRKILDSLNMKEIKIINKAGAIKPFSSMEIVAGESGANAFEMIAGYSRKRGIFINSDGDGNIILFQISGDVFPDFTFDNGEILSSSLEINHAERFNKYVVKSQAQSTSDWSSNKATFFRKAESIDSEIRSSRYMEMVAEESMNNEECKTRANEDANIRRARSINYNLVVAEHSQKGKVFEIGKGIRVNDLELGVSGTFLIQSLEFLEDETGRTTSLNLTYPDAYSLEAQISMKSQKRIDLNAYLSKSNSGGFNV